MDRARRANLYERFERAIEIPMLILSLVFLMLVLAQEMTTLDAVTSQTIEVMLGIIWGSFAAELALKLYLAPDRKAFLISHWADVLIVALPFLRVVRLLRVIPVSMRAWRQLRRIFRSNTLSMVGLTSLITLIMSSVLVYLAEVPTDSPIENYGDALWWATATITTVGYGDMYPVTALGRGVAVFLMLTGIALFGLLTANVAAFFVEEDKQTHQEADLNQVLERLNQIEHQLTSLQQARHLPRLRSYRSRIRR
ncbi:MAG: potassium channel family protein [Oscillochloridaceae bacterium umkhey_bin13]